MMEKMERVAKVEEEEMADVVEEVERVEIEAGKNTEKIVTSREVETSTGQINSRLLLVLSHSLSSPMTSKKVFK